MAERRAIGNIGFLFGKWEPLKPELEAFRLVEAREAGEGEPSATGAVSGVAHGVW
jgi:hypothetical protein